MTSIQLRQHGQIIDPGYAVSRLDCCTNTPCTFQNTIELQDVEELAKFRNLHGRPHL
ncbi:hypothetical protein [uncultured Ruegeria sp.]|uniref:hypothetical protein n=1 Tax=uncultured Ruegeria sp. TaxID=259304 RepID=UPI00261F3D88|nr:hypothetical protein [uncultured Ruegeria sp.]